MFGDAWNAEEFQKKEEKKEEEGGGGGGEEVEVEEKKVEEEEEKLEDLKEECWLNINAFWGWMRRM